jgi:hypothetical protein
VSSLLLFLVRAFGVVSSNSATLLILLFDIVTLTLSRRFVQQVDDYVAIDHRSFISVSTMEDIEVPIFAEHSIGVDSPTATMLSVWRTMHRITETAFDDLMQVPHH